MTQKASSYKLMEIERKYEIYNKPDHLETYEVKRIEQGYLCHNPTIRIRKCNVEYILTYKSKFGLIKKELNAPVINHEIELPLSREAYQELKNKIDGNMIYKKRYLIPLSPELTVELDVFEDKLLGLMIAEVEFPDEETSYSFIPPNWFGKELSSDKRFSNYNLSKLSNIKELDES